MDLCLPDIFVFSHLSLNISSRSRSSSELTMNATVASIGNENMLKRINPALRLAQFTGQAPDRRDQHRQLRYT